MPYLRPPDHGDGYDVYTDLRTHILTIRPAELGLAPSARLPRVWAALMEQGSDVGIASLVMAADGTTSMYTSTGGGMIGAGFYQEVVRATLAFLDAVEAHLDLLQPVDVLPLPRTGTVRFNALTYGSPRSAEADSAEVVGGELTALYVAGHRVITQLRLLEQRPEWQEER
jgi:hypothetical protein